MRFIREFFIFVFAGLALVYLFLPSLLPDLIPFVGWLDEGVATTIILSAFKHWGLDLTSLFGDREKSKEPLAIGGDVIVDEQNGRVTRKVRIPREVLERALAEYQQEQQYSQR